MYIYVYIYDCEKWCHAEKSNFQLWQISLKLNFIHIVDKLGYN